MSLRSMSVFQRAVCGGAVLLAGAACLWVPITSGQGRGRGGGEGNAQASSRDWTQDMKMKITEPFTLASVGDIIIMRPASQFDDPSFQSALKIVRDADVGFGNFESLMRDETHFEGPLGGMFGTKETAADVKAMGFQIVNRAGNHLMDSNQEGLFETMKLMEQAGLVYAGAGRDLDDARAARFLESKKGRIGIVGMYGNVSSGGQSRLAATYRMGNTGGKPGLNALGLTRIIYVSPEQLDALKKIRDSIYAHRTDYSNPVEPPSNEPAGQVDLFGQQYKAGDADKQGQQSYVMNPGDLRDNLRSIKNGKEYADFMIATIHAHQGATELQQWLFEDTTPDFLITLAHDSIDNGADVFVGHGPHVLKGIEIYKGKPIFYDLGEFFREWDWGCDCDADPTSSVTPAERNLKFGVTAQQVNYESLITVSKYDKGLLQEVRLYPIDGGYAGPISRRGIPHMAAPDVAQRILQRMQKLSEPFGTKIAIESNVGVIRAVNTVDVGQNRVAQ